MIFVIFTATTNNPVEESNDKILCWGECWKLRNKYTIHWSKVITGVSAAGALSALLPRKKHNSTHVSKN